MLIAHHTRQHRNDRVLNHVLSSFCQSYGNEEGFLILHHSPPSIAPEHHRVFVCLNPVLKLQLDGEIEYSITRDEIREHRPLTVLRQVQSAITSTGFSPAIPVLAGMLTYEFLHHIESIPVTIADQFELPEYVFFLYSLIIEIAPDPSIPCVQHVLSFDSLPEPFWEAHEVLSHFEKQSTDYQSVPFSPVDLSQCYAELEAASNTNASTYQDTIESIRQHIREGDVYQVNLSQRFAFPFPFPASKFYSETISARLAEHGAFFHVKNRKSVPVSVISESPETFFHLSQGKITTSPIKGTIQRSADDQAAIMALKKSKKDNAELAMIVDLLRNDLGKVSVPGSIEVAAHARLQSTPSVHHLVSDISGTLRNDASAVDVLLALFPCGSITGAPKFAAMQYIAHYEQQHRGIYTGSIGFFTPGGAACFSVAIRTATIIQDQLTFQAGGGIVYPSVPHLEYQESLAKASSLYHAYRRVVDDGIRI